MIFLRGRRESWLIGCLEINTHPFVCCSVNFKQGSICVSEANTCSHILLLSLLSSCTNNTFYECLFNCQCCLCFFADDNPLCTPTARDSYERLSLAGQALPPGFPSPFLFPDGLSSIETLLTNIQVLSTARSKEQ